MFGFFSKKPSKQDIVSYCTKLATEARIDVVFDNGNYSGFLIFLEADGSSLVNHFKSQEAYSAFVEAIEQRVRDGQFDDPSNEISMVKEMRELTGWKKNLNVVRAVIGRGNKPLFSWNLPQ